MCNTINGFTEYTSTIIPPPLVLDWKSVEIVVDMEAGEREREREREREVGWYVVCVIYSAYIYTTTLHVEY